jgi:alpha-galactosidase
VLDSAVEASPAPLRLPGLLSERVYRLAPVALPGGGAPTTAGGAPRWMETGVSLTGRQLAVHGIQPPTLDPESAVIIRLEAAR